MFNITPTKPCVLIKLKQRYEQEVNVLPNMSMYSLNAENVLQT